jgi:hypothetical protein
MQYIPVGMNVCQFLWQSGQLKVALVRAAKASERAAILRTPFLKRFNFLEVFGF